MNAHTIKHSESCELLPVPGTLQAPFKLVIIGGGPAGCSIIIRAIRSNFISELCGFEEAREEKVIPTEQHISRHALQDSSVDVDPKPQGDTPTLPLRLAGVCLIDGGKEGRFGGGKLQDYWINSNTYADKFATNVIEEKPDNLPKESIKNTLIEQMLYGSKSTQCLQRYGAKVAPLEDVGAFLRDVGGVVRSTLGQFPHSSRCLLETKVACLQRVLLHPRSVEKQVIQGDELESLATISGWKIFLKSSSSSESSIEGGVNGVDCAQAHANICPSGGGLGGNEYRWRSTRIRGWQAAMR